MSLARGNRKKDLHWFLRQIEQVIMNVLNDFDIEGERDAAGTGVWVEDKKIAAIGLSASKWITMHGFSLNVSPDLHCFQGIIPCGINGRGVTSLHQLNQYVTSEEVAKSIMQQFGNVFGHNGTMHTKSYPSCKGIDSKLFETLPLHR
jgi:lipoyl(octanoyl) transferase